tara:strand:+ start:2204 stop:2839 length:636 start_codon:yes stop_codon:yes gene_type:complete
MNKITILYLLIAIGFGSENLALSDNQILSYEIPPSAYLEKLAKISEKKAPRPPDFLGLLSIGMGVMIIMANSTVVSSENPSLPGWLAGGLFVWLGGNRISKKISSGGAPISDEMKMFKEIENELDREKREVMSYNSLVFFASNSKNSKKPQSNSNNSSPGKASFKDMVAFLLLKSVIEESVKSERIFDSAPLQQRALDGFLNQMPINIVFD